MTTPRLMIYGATGFTGRLIAREAKERAFDAVLAGRSAARLEPLARSLGLPWRTFDVERADEIAEALTGVSTVLNVAGPYRKTALPLATACVACGAHYLDVSGEVMSYRKLDDLEDSAKGAGVLVMPGVGFCVLVSNYMVRALASTMPDVERVRIAFSGGPVISIGSFKSLIETIGDGVTILRHQRRITLPIGRLERAFEFGAERTRLPCTAIGLADSLSTSRIVGTVRDAESYIEANLAARIVYESAGRFSVVTQFEPGKSVTEFAMSYWPPTPDVWAPTVGSVVVEVEDAWQRSRSARLEVDDVYRFSAVLACAAADVVMTGKVSAPGFRVPGEVLFGVAEVDAAFAKLSRAVP